MVLFRRLVSAAAILITYLTALYENMQEKFINIQKTSQYAVVIHTAKLVNYNYLMRHKVPLEEGD